MTDFDAVLARTVLFMDIEDAIKRREAHAEADPVMAEDLHKLIAAAFARGIDEGRCTGPDDFRNLLVELAAHAVAAVEGHDRQHNRRGH